LHRTPLSNIATDFLDFIVLFNWKPSLNNSQPYEVTNRKERKSKELRHLK